MPDVTPDEILKAAVTPRWSALTALGGVSADLANYDRFLVREPRLLVPVDVQALVVRAGVNDTEGMIRLPFRNLTAEPPLDVHDTGQKRPPGVHLLWSVPAALGHGKVVDDPAAPDDATRRRLDLPALPDRWAVLRLAVPAGATDPLVTGWVIEADAGTVTPLTDWPNSTANTQTVADPPLTAGSTRHARRRHAWVQCYDAAAGRLALYDSLKDLDGLALEADAISYLVAGWWSNTDDDPLNGVGTDLAYHQRLSELGWNDVDHPSTQQSRSDQTADRFQTATIFGLAAPSRYSQEVALRAGHAANIAIASGQVAQRRDRIEPSRQRVLEGLPGRRAGSAGPDPVDAAHRAAARRAAQGRSGRRRPAAATDTLKVVLGASTPDLASTVAASGTGLGATGPASGGAAARGVRCRATMELADTNAWSDIDDYEHSHGFGSLPGGIEGIDRFVDKPPPRTDPGAGFRPGAVISPVLPKLNAEATVLWSAIERPSTVRQDDDRGRIAADSRRHRRHPAELRAAPGPTGRRPGSRGATGRRRASSSRPRRSSQWSAAGGRCRPSSARKPTAR